MTCYFHPEIEMICIEDFCGNSYKYNRTKYQVNFWADWCPECKEIHFGGYWHYIPNLKAEHEPNINDDFVKRHIDAYEHVCEDNYWKAILESP